MDLSVLYPVFSVSLDIASFFLALGITIVILLLGSMLVEFYWKWWQIRHLPGPPCLPIVGNYPNPSPADARKLMEYHLTYPSLFKLSFGPLPQIMLNDPKIVGEVFYQKMKCFHNRPYVSKNPFFIFRQSLINMRDEPWQKSRRIIAPQFSWAQVKDYSDTMIEKGDKIVERLSQYKDGEVINIHGWLSKSTMDVICKSAFGYDPDHLSKANEPLVRAINDVFNPSILMAMIPKWYWVPLKDNRKRVSGIAYIRNTVHEIIAKRHEARERGEDVPHDLLNALMDATDPQTGEKLDNIEIFDQSFTMFLAGHETTASTMTWMLTELAKNPDVEDKLIAEIDEKIGRDGEVTAESIKDCEMLTMVAKETLRLYPVVASITRECKEETTVDGVLIPKGASIWVSVYTMHRNPKYWEEPDKFWPERFSKENERKIVPYSYVPFGVGHRVCVGQRFALTELKIILVKVLQKYTFKKVEDYEPTIFHFTKPKDHVNMAIYRRPANN